MALNYRSSEESFQKAFLFPFLICMLLFSLTACEESSEKGESSSEQDTPNSFHISGKVEDPLIDNISLSFEPFRKYRTFKTDLDSSGHFSMEVPIERPSFFQLRQGNISLCQVFAEPGDSIRLEANGKKLNETLSFSGDGKERNRYLLDLKRFINDTLGQAKKGLFDDELLKGDPSRFNLKIDSVYRMQEDLLAEHRDSLDEDFLRLEKDRMAFERALQRLRFRNRLNHKGRDSLDLGSDFWSPIEELDMTASRNVALPSYFSFLKRYGIQLRKEAIAADSGLADSARFPVLYRAFKEEVDDDTARSAFLAKNLYYQLRMRGVKGTTPFVEELEKGPLFRAVQDSLQKLHDEWKTLAKGNEAPGFSYPNVEGDTLALEDLKGKHVYIDAWATWCMPCKKEIPHLKTLQERFPEDEVAFVSISLDRERSEEKWKKMVGDKELAGHQLFANGKAFDSKLTEDYLIKSIPRFILIGPDGKIIDANADRPSKDAEEQLRKALGKEKGA